MSHPRTCPGCAAPVSAEDAARGTCGYCGQPLEEVVELGEPDASPADVPAAPTPPAEEVVELGPEAEVAPEPPPAPMRTRVEVETPEPRAPRPITRSDSTPARRQPSRSVSRVRDDADDEFARPRSRRPEKSGGGGKKLLIAGVVLAVLFVPCVGLGAVAYWLAGRSSDVAQTPRTARGGSAPTAVTSEKERGWANLPQADGFEARLPIGAAGGPRTVMIDGEPTRGHRYAVEEGGIEYRAEWYDFPAERTKSPEAFVRTLRQIDGLTTAPPTRSSVVRLGELNGVELTFIGADGRKDEVRTYRVGARVFVFVVSPDPARTSEPPGLDSEAKQKAFFDSIRITYRPTAPTNATKPTGKARSPVTQPPAETRPAVTLTRQATVFPHTTSVNLPQSREVLTFVPHGAKGLLHRYEVPAFRHVKRVGLPNPVSLAVADEKAGRLYVATYAPGAERDPRERLDAVGDVQAFDLAAARADAPPEAGLTPVGTCAVGAKVTALELAPDGKTLYVVAVYTPEELPAKPKTRLLKLALPGLTPAGETEFPTAILGARLSPDGTYLLAFEHPFTGAGLPVFGTGETADLRVIDAAGWKPVRTVLLPGLASDLRFTAADRAVVIVTTANRPKLYSVGVTGEPIDVTPTGGLKSLQAGYLGWSPGRLVTSTRIPGTTGAEVLAPKSKGLAESLAFESMLHSATLSGPVTVTSDGRYAVFASGVVAEIKVGK